MGLPTPPIIDAAGQATILDNAINQITTQLAPLQANLIDATLNLQSQASPDQITVTALDLKVLPAAQQFGVNALELQVGTSKCGSSGEVAVEAASASSTPTKKPSPQPTREPKPRQVPTAVPAGAATANGPSGGQRDWGVLALGGLLTIGGRRRRRRLVGVALPAMSAERTEASAAKRVDAAHTLDGLWRVLIGLGVLAVVAGLLLHSGSDDAPSPYARLKPADPVRVKVASLKLNATVVPIAVDANRVLDPPRDTDDVGWWDQSAQPGRRTGQTVITGHTVHTGGGAMDRLSDVRRGAAIDVVTGAGTVRYRVQRTATLSHDELAAQAQQLFGQGTGDGRLVLVTCADWNGSYYESNVVVLARRLGQPVSTT